jgi:glycosyltransferase involved in cell wall biosynthesis
MADRRFRVLAIATHPVQYAAPLFRRMAARPDVDFQVAYCTLRGAEAAHDPDFGTTIQWDVPLLDGYRWTREENHGSGADSFWGLRNPSLWKLIRKGNFDAVLCYVGYVRASFWIAWFAAKLSDTAFLFGTDATTVFPRDGKYWKKPVKMILWPRLFRLADQVLALSGAGVEFMRSLGIPRDRITLTPFVVDNDWWGETAAAVDRDAVRACWDLPPGAAVILFCAKLQPWKRPLDLLRAFARAELSNCVLVFAGDGALRAQLESEAISLGVGGRVRFLGFLNQTELPGAYRAANLLVLPSEYDPCPVVVCEAMICGCPVMISDEIRGRFDLVRPGSTGDIFACRDIDGLVSSLRNLLSDRERLKLLGENARQRMLTWSPAENIAGTMEAIRLAVSRKSRRPTTPLADSTASHSVSTVSRESSR